MTAPAGATPYERLATVGEGPLAVVWRGRTAGPLGYERPVCIRDLHRALSDHRRFLQTLLDAHGAVADLDHPSVETLLDAVEVGPACLLITPWIEGLRLDRWTADGPLPWADATAITLQVLDALGAVHERGGVHGAVTARTVRMGVDGRARLTHLAVAAALEAAGWSAEERDAAALRPRTPDEERGEEPTASTDLFAAAALLFGAIEGRAPFVRGHDPHRFRPPPLTAEAPGELSAVLAQALAPRPDQRFAHAEAFAHALRRLLRRLEAPPAPRDLRAGLAVARARAAEALPAAAPAPALPRGIANVRTMHVDLSELREVPAPAQAPPPSVPPGPPPAAEAPPPLPPASEVTLPRGGEVPIPQLSDPGSPPLPVTRPGDPQPASLPETRPGTPPPLPLGQLSTTPLGTAVGPTQPIDPRRAAVDALRPEVVRRLVLEGPYGLSEADSEHLDLTDLRSMLVDGPPALAAQGTEYLSLEELWRLRMDDG
ncbi:MAG: hypothetical protein ACFCGT_00505 [Sandaracinaceae bacterium]